MKRLLAASAILLACSTLHAQTSTTTTASGDLFTASNWSHGYPSISTTAIITQPMTCTGTNTMTAAAFVLGDSTNNEYINVNSPANIVLATTGMITVPGSANDNIFTMQTYPGASPNTGTVAAPPCPSVAAGFYVPPSNNLYSGIVCGDSAALYNNTTTNFSITCGTKGYVVASAGTASTEANPDINYDGFPGRANITMNCASISSSYTQLFSVQDGQSITINGSVAWNPIEFPGPQLSDFANGCSIGDPGTPAEQFPYRRHR